MKNDADGEFLHIFIPLCDPLLSESLDHVTNRQAVERLRKLWNKEITLERAGKSISNLFNNIALSFFVKKLLKSKLFYNKLQKIILTVTFLF